jgi:hypothetical protein
MMDTEILNEGDPSIPAAPVSSSDTTPPDVPPSRAALVKQWQDRIRRAQKYWRPRFKKMRKAQYLSTMGATEEWVKANRYVVPVVVRYINQIVAQLYAKNPKATATRKRRMMYKIWDGQPESFMAAIHSVQNPPTDPTTGQPIVDPMTGQPAIDPNALAIVQEIQQVQQYNRMVDGAGKTLEILWDYFLKAQEVKFKTQFKSALRRSKVTGVGYVKLCFQRVLEQRPEIAAQIDDVTSQISALQQMMDEVTEGDIQPDDAKMEELRLLQKQLQDQAYIVVREGPVFDFPAAHEILIDPKCRNLKTFAGARWVAHSFDLMPDEIEEIYKVDVGSSFTAYTGPKNDQEGASRSDIIDDSDRRNSTGGKDQARVHEIHDRKLGQCMVICEGYPDFLREPGTPDVVLSRFWPIFSLVFNEPESDVQIHPESDVMLLRDTQMAYNASRQGLKEHRQANKPRYFAPAGAVQEEDKVKLASFATGALLELRGLKPGQDVNNLIALGKTFPIDPQQYEVEGAFNDILRTVGSQEANIGGSSSDTTATQSSIAEESRTAAIADSVDDLDDVLSDLAHATGELMLLNMSKDMVLEIVGPGAVWPDMPSSREDISKDLYLDVMAGSSGRRNASADLAKWERAMPIVLQTPGGNPKAIWTKIAPLLDMDVDDVFLAGAPSIAALNAAAGQASQPGADPSQNPNAQGPQGPQNAARPQGPVTTRPQPQFPGQRPPLTGPGHNVPTPTAGPVPGSAAA